MSDVFSEEKRSEIMRTVKSSGNKSTEVELIKFFKEENIKGWRRNYNLFGYPDFVFPQKKIAVFADGCFWHGHDCRNLKPDSNKGYWNKKIDKNKKRDKKVTEELEKKGWIVIRVWECEIKERAFHNKFIQLKK